MVAGTAPLIDALLVQATLPAGGAAQIPDLLRSLRGAPGVQGTQGFGKTSPVTLHAAFNPAKSLLYAYLHLSERAPMTQPAAVALEAALRREWPLVQHLQVSRLEKVLDQPGASAGAQPAFHYVVEMDPETGWMPQLADWYDTEHLPGLAQVPGCVRASRFLNHDHGPLSLACYDLVTEDTLGSAPWLAVRETDWSSRMRPHFTNTVRTMFSLSANAHHS